MNQISLTVSNAVVWVLYVEEQATAQKRELNIANNESNFNTIRWTEAQSDLMDLKWASGSDTMEERQTAEHEPVDYYRYKTLQNRTDPSGNKYHEIALISQLFLDGRLLLK